MATYWKGRKIRLKLYLIKQISCNLLPQIEKKSKMSETNVGHAKCKIGSLSNMREKKVFLKTAGN